MENRKVKGSRIGRMELVYQRMVKIRSVSVDPRAEYCQYWPNDFVQKQWLKMKVSQMNKLTSKIHKHRGAFLPLQYSCSLCTTCLRFPGFLASVFDQPTHTLADPVVTSCHLSIVSQLTVVSWLPGDQTKHTDAQLVMGWSHDFVASVVWAFCERILQLLLSPCRVWRDLRVGEVIGLVSWQFLWLAQELSEPDLM